MSKAQRKILSYLSLLFAVTCPQYSWAGDKNRDYLELPREQLDIAIIASIDIAGHIAFLENEGQGTCIWNWLADDVEARKSLVIRSMEKYPDEAPTSIIIALVERECGKFPRSADQAVK